jgi:hypothetical protein
LRKGSDGAAHKKKKKTKKEKQEQNRKEQRRRISIPGNSTKKKKKKTKTHRVLVPLGQKVYSPTLPTHSVRLLEALAVPEEAVMKKENWI